MKNDLILKLEEVSNRFKKNHTKSGFLKIFVVVEAIVSIKLMT